MSHLFDSGLTRNRPTWHGNGIVIDDAQAVASWQELAPIALPWEVTTTPVVAVAGHCVGMSHRDLPEAQRPYAVALAGTHATCVTCLPAAIAAGLPISEAITATGKMATRRDDNGNVLGVVGEGYTPWFNRNMGDVHRAMIDAGFLTESIGGVDGGRKVYIQYYADKGITIPGDEGQTFPMVALMNSHDASSSLVSRGTSTRVECANTFGMVSRQKGGTLFKMRHTSSLADRKGEAIRAMASLGEFHDRYAEVMTALAAVKTDTQTIAAFLGAYVPLKTDATERQETNVDRARQGIVDVLHSPTVSNHDRDAYGLLMAVTEFNEHHKPRVRDRGAASLTGSHDGDNLRALSLITELVERPDLALV